MRQNCDAAMCTNKACLAIITTNYIGQGIKAWAKITGKCSLKMVEAQTLN